MSDEELATQIMEDIDKQVDTTVYVGAVDNDRVKPKKIRATKARDTTTAVATTIKKKKIIDVKKLSKCDINTETMSIKVKIERLEQQLKKHFSKLHTLESQVAYSGQVDA